MKKILILIFLLSSSVKGHAHMQPADLLIYKYDTIPIYTNILEEYLKKNETKNELELRAYNNDCPLNYTVMYKIQNDSLFIDKIINCSKNIDKKTHILDLLKNKRINGRIFVDWFSGDLSSQPPQLSRETNLTKEEFKSIIIFRINKGIVVKTLYNGIELMHFSNKETIRKPTGKNRKQ